MEITVQIRDVFGRNLTYPLCEEGKFFTRLLDRKTLSKKHLSIIEDYGHTVKWEPREK